MPSNKLDCFRYIFCFFKKKWNVNSQFLVFLLSSGLKKEKSFSELEKKEVFWSSTMAFGQYKASKRFIPTN